MDRVVQIRARSWRAVRWFVRHGAARLVLAALARRRQPIALILHDPSTQADPFPLLDEMRQEEGLAGGSLALATCRHGLSGDILRDQSFEAGASSSPVAAWALGRSRDLAALGPLDSPSLLVSDPPDHTRRRKLVAKVFTPRAVRDLGPRIEVLAAGLLDELDATHEVDLVESYAKRLPVAVIADLMGVPSDMLDQFLEWSDRGAPSLELGLTYEAFADADDAIRETNRWLVQHIASLREQPRPGLLGELLSVAENGTRLSEVEILSTVQLLLAAGFVTMVDLLGSGAVLLMRHRDQLDALLAAPDGWPNAIEEILRLESPVQVTARFAAEDMHVGGRRVPRGQAVLTMLGGANRDPSVFESPHQFDIKRGNARDHLAFSRGIHHCLGSGLGRLEGEVGLRALFERFPRMVLAAEPERRPGAVLRGYRRIPVLLNGSH